MESHNGSNCKDTGTYCCFGCPGTTAWTTITESGTGADGRTSVGDGEGIYSGFFNTTNITKVALVHGHDGSADITPGSGGAWTRYVVYDLVESTGSETLYEILKRLDTWNKNNPSWTVVPVMDVLMQIVPHVSFLVIILVDV